MSRRRPLCLIPIAALALASGCLISSDANLWKQAADAGVDRSNIDMVADVPSDQVPLDGPVPEAAQGDDAHEEMTSPDTSPLDSAPDGTLDGEPDTARDLGQPDMSCGQMVLQVTSNGDDGEVDNGSFMVNGEGGTLLMGAWGNNPTWSFFRFKLDQALPASAVITGATLELWGTDEQQWDLASYALDVWLEDAADAPWVTKVGDAPSQSGGRPTTTTKVRWPAAGGLYWRVGQYNTSPDLALLLQELVNSYGGLVQDAYVQLWIRGSQSNEAEVGTHNFLEAGYAASPHELTISWCE